MNYVTVCGGSSDGLEYAMGLAIGLAFNVVLWIHHRGRTGRAASPPILPLKGLARSDEDLQGMSSR